MTRTAATSAPLHPLLAERWSPRGFDAAHHLAEPQLRALLEAARWSPSANNSQPWRFVVTAREAAPRTRRSLDELVLPTPVPLGRTA